VSGIAAIPDVKWEIGLTGPTTDPTWWHVGDPVRGVVGTFTVPPEDVWSDITDWVRSWSLRRGAARGDGVGPIRYEAGTCTLELNNGDRRFDPTNLSGPYVSGGVSLLTPMVRVRGTAYYAGVPYRLITTLADFFKPQYPGPTWSTVTLAASDAFKVFTSMKRTAVAAVGGGEDAGARIGRILNSLGWPVDDRIIEAGDTLLQATTLEGDGLAELQLTTDSESGEFYIDPDGNTVFRRRHAILADARSNTAQAVFGDGGGSEIPYRDTAVDSDDATMANYVSITRVGGTEQVASDATSIARFLQKDYSRSDLIMQTDADGLNYAQMVLYQHKDPEVRFSSVELGIPRPANAALAWPVMFGLELGDRVTVVRRPPGGGTNTQDCYVRGIEHAEGDGNWTTTFALESASRSQFWTIGHPTLGQVGTGNAIAW
jgi:hypothetical protein